MMPSSVPFLLLAFSSVLSAPSAPYDGSEVVVPQKRAALVLDRLLIALQNALHDEAVHNERDGPRTAPLRIAGLDDTDMMDLRGEGQAAGFGLRDFEYGPRSAPLRVSAVGDDTSSLQRRGQGSGRGRVLRCYFNAVTCF